MWGEGGWLSGVVRLFLSIMRPSDGGKWCVDRDSLGMGEAVIMGP